MRCHGHDVWDTVVIKIERTGSRLNETFKSGVSACDSSGKWRMTLRLSRSTRRTFASKVNRVSMRTEVDEVDEEE